jgi:predicted GIY-YIG superfamily endonuclease
MARGFGSGSSGSRSRGGSRGNNGTRGGSRTYSSSPAGRSARSSSTKSNLAKPKGQIRDGKAVQYSIKDQKGNTKYIGSTNNPTRRESEHRESGKVGRKDKLVVETRPVSRPSAEKVEKAKLRSHRQQHGKNPRHNTTNDGQFHQPQLL